MGFGQKLHTVHSLSTIIASHCSLRKYTWHLNLNFHSVPFSYKCFKEAFKHIFYILYDKYFIIENYKQWSYQLWAQSSKHTALLQLSVLVVVFWWDCSQETIYLQSSLAKKQSWKWELYTLSTQLSCKDLGSASAPYLLKTVIKVLYKNI